LLELGVQYFNPLSAVHKFKPLDLPEVMTI